MSQGGSRRPYSRGGPRWHPRYKDYWDYEQNYSDGSSAGSPKEACAGQSPPPPAPPPPPPAPPAKRDGLHHHHHHDQRRLSIDLRGSPGAGAGPSAEPPHLMHTHHHHLDTNPLEGSVGVVAEPLVTGAGSSDGELSSKAGDSPTRKRRRISRHLSSGESNVSVSAPVAERRTPRHHYQPPRRMRYMGTSGPVWGADRAHHQAAHRAHHVPHHAPLLLDINQMSLRGARLGALGGGVTWPHAPHHTHPHSHPHPHQHPHAHREHAQRTQIGGVYAGLQYAPPPRGPFASPQHAHTHYITNSQRAEGGRLDMLGNGEGTLSPLQPPPDLHHAPLLLAAAAEARGAPLDLMGPHHTRSLSHHHHRRSGAVGSVSGVGAVGGVGVVGSTRARPYVRHAPRWPHHPIHHIHTQGGGGLVGAAIPAHVQAQLHVAQPLPLPPPPPTYQVFLNLLAMFPLSPYSEARGEESADSPETENYEALLSLAERLGEAKPRGLPRHHIDQLPSYKYSPQNHQGEQTSCVVCMCEFESRQTLRVLPCAHEFHAKCVDKWLRSNRTCPICRGNASEYFSHSE